MKRILALIFLLLLVISLISCNVANKENADSENNDLQQEIMELASVKADGFYIEEVIRNYEGLIIEAINNNELSFVENLLAPDSKLYKAQKQLVQDLYNKGIKERLLEYTIEDIEETGETGIYKIYVNETIEIDYPTKDKVIKDFAWIYTSVEKDGSVRLTDIETWNKK